MLASRNFGSVYWTRLGVTILFFIFLIFVARHNTIILEDATDLAKAKTLPLPHLGVIVDPGNPQVFIHAYGLDHTFAYDHRDICEVKGGPTIAIITVVREDGKLFTALEAGTRLRQKGDDVKLATLHYCQNDYGDLARTLITIN